MDHKKQQHKAFHALLNPREAMTVAVRVQLSPSVVDTRFVAVTPRAAALFGYTNPAELEGQYTSTVHVLEDIQRTRLRSTLRAMGLVQPTEQYEVRILQRSGAIQRVRKTVEQRQLDAETMVWICHLEPADTQHPFHPPPLPTAIPEEALHQFFGWACVAEIEALLRQQRLLLTFVPNRDILLPNDALLLANTTAIQPLERLALHGPRVYYKCHCLVCEREWIAGGQEHRAFVPPRRCNYDDCRAHAWNDPLAAPAARRKRARRRSQP